MQDESGQGIPSAAQTGRQAGQGTGKLAALFIPGGDEEPLSSQNHRIRASLNLSQTKSYKPRSPLNRGGEKNPIKAKKKNGKLRQIRSKD